MAEPPNDQRTQETLRIEDALTDLRILILEGMSRGLLRANSRWALLTAAGASHIEGVSGTLILRLPGKPGDHIELMFVSGDPEVVSRPAGGAR